MKPIPKTSDTLLLRTDFQDELAWKNLVAAIEAPRGEFRACVSPVSDEAFDGATAEQVVAAAAGGHRFVLIADRAAVHEAEHAVLVVDVGGEPGRSFRAIPSVAWSVENNLALANMDFEEFLDAADDDGVFRGF